MTKTKSSLINKLGTILLGATGLVEIAGLTGCQAPQGNRNVYPYVQSQPQAYQSQSQSQPQPYKPEVQNDGNLEMAILGGVLGAGLLGTALPANMNPVARAATEATAKGIGNGILADATRSKTNVQVNVNGSQPNAQLPVVYAPEPQTLDERLLPEYDEQLKREFDEKRISGHPLYGGIFSVITSKNTLDLNGDNTITFDEFIGKRRNFKQGETLRVNACIKSCTDNLFLTKVPCDYQITCEVFNEKGESLSRVSQTGKQKQYDESQVVSFYFSGFKPGVYNAKCSYLNSNDKKSKHKSERGAVFQVLEDK